MKKMTKSSLLAFLDGDTSIDVTEAREELRAEIARDAEKAQANRNAYAEAHDIIMHVVDDTPRTVKEIYALCADILPDGFSPNKIQYAMREYWKDEVIRHEGEKRDPLKYSKK